MRRICLGVCLLSLWPIWALGQVAETDSVPTLPGLTWAAPEDSLGWRGVTRVADLDSLLLGGQGIVLAFEDTFSFDPGTADTLLVSAPRVTVAEVVAAIGRRMEYDAYRLGSYDYTQLTTTVLRQQPGVNGGDYSIFEEAVRYHQDRESGTQKVKLWERKREYKDGELTTDEVDDEMKADYVSVTNALDMAMPFAPGSAKRYNYVILERNLVGNSLIYKIRFTPRNRFEALPSGTIWVDCSNWVLRKLEAELVDVVPFPMFLKSVPVYRLSQERFGDFWFPTEAYVRLNMRRIPLVPTPSSVEVRVSLRDIHLAGDDGASRDTGAPGAGVSGLTPEELAAGFWLGEKASDDSLAAYWQGIDRQWDSEVTDKAAPVSLSAARIDSLTTEGDKQLRQLRAGAMWRGELGGIPGLGYNRAQGAVVRLGFSLHKLGPDRPKLDLAAGYAFASQRPVFTGRLKLPLSRARWRLAHPSRDGQKYLGAQYQRFALGLNGRKDGRLFAGDGRRQARSASAFFYGSDPNHYYEERGYDGRLQWRLTRGLTVHGGGGYRENRAWGQQTSWNVLGRSLRPEGNRAAENLNDTFATAGGTWRHGSVSLAGDMTWHDLDGRSLREWEVTGAVDVLDPMGNQWLLRGAHRGFDGTAPVQWKSWLGDYGTLRGYQAGELTGDEGAHASLDARLGFDVWRATRVPLLKNWGLQPLGFVDWGKTWNATGSTDGPDEGARGWRMDVGFGFGKRFDVPVVGGFSNVRVYAAHAVAEGSADEGWRVLVGFEK